MNFAEPKPEARMSRQLPVQLGYMLPASALADWDTKPQAIVRDLLRTRAPCRA